MSAATRPSGSTSSESTPITPNRLSFAESILSNASLEDVPTGGEGNVSPVGSEGSNASSHRAESTTPTSTEGTTTSTESTTTTPSETPPEVVLQPRPGVPLLPLMLLSIPVQPIAAPAPPIIPLLRAPAVISSATPMLGFAPRSSREFEKEAQKAAEARKAAEQSLEIHSRQPKPTPSPPEEVVVKVVKSPTGALSSVYITTEIPDPVMATTASSSSTTISSPTATTTAPSGEPLQTVSSSLFTGSTGGSSSVSRMQTSSSSNASLETTSTTKTAGTVSSTISSAGATLSQGPVLPVSTPPAPHSSPSPEPSGKCLRCSLL